MYPPCCSIASETHSTLSTVNCVPQAKVDRGVASSIRYMNYKWGCGDRDRKDFLVYDCKHKVR
jgi:hypothetical protein